MAAGLVSYLFGIKAKAAYRGLKNSKLNYHILKFVCLNKTKYVNNSVLQILNLKHCLAVLKDLTKISLDSISVLKSIILPHIYIHIVQ